MILFLLKIVLHGSKSTMNVILAIGEDEVVIGWGSLSAWSSRIGYKATGEVSIYISDSCKGQGIGTFILDHLLIFAKDHGYHTIISCIAKGNPGSIRIHEKHDFEQVGLLKEAGMKFGQLIDVIIMQRML